MVVIPPQTTRPNAATGHELAATAHDNRARTSWQPPLAPTTPTTPTRPDGTRPASQNRAHFAPNTPFSAHPAETDYTLSTTPTTHRTTPPRNGEFYYHRTPVTACRRRVAPLWSQFPQTTRPNAATGHELAGSHPSHRRRRPRLRPAQRAPQRPDYGDYEPHTLARPPDMTRMHGVQDTCLGNIFCLFFTLLITTFNTDFSAPLSRKVPGQYTRFTF